MTRPSYCTLPRVADCRECSLSSYGLDCHNVSISRREGTKAAMARRWGGRGPSATARVDKDAAAALLAVPERDRRRVASDAVRQAAKNYLAGKS